MSVSMIFNDHQEEKTVAAPPSEEELNPYSIFPQPEENSRYREGMNCMRCHHIHHTMENLNEIILTALILVI